MSYLYNFSSATFIWVLIIFHLLLPSIATADTTGRDRLFDLDIPSQSRHLALIQLASETGYDILFEAGASSKDKVDGIRGNYSISVALESLLAHSELEYKINEMKIRIFHTKSRVTSLSRITVLGYLGDTTRKISENDDGQYEFPLYQLPLSIQSVSDEYVEEIQARDFREIISYIGGIEYFESTNGITPLYYSRGISTFFSINGKLYLRSSNELDPALIQRVDFIPGPTANYLRPGGILNIVTKKPMETSKVSYAAEVGSSDFYRAEIDTNVYSKNDHEYGFRIIGVSESSKNIKKFAFDKKQIIGISFVKPFSEHIQFSSSIIHNKQSQYPNTTTYHDSILGKKLPQDQTMGAPWGESKTSSTIFTADIANENLGGWRSGIGINWYGSKSDLLSSGVAPFPCPGSAPSEFPKACLISFHQYGNRYETYGLDMHIEKGFSLFDYPVLIRTGIDYQQYDQLSLIHPNEIIGDFDVTNPDYGSFPRPSSPDSIGESLQLTDFTGIYIAPSLYATDNITLYSDFRYEYIKLRGNANNSVANTRREFDDSYNELTSKLGLNVSLSPDFSSHIAYSESFTHQVIPKAGPIDDINANTAGFVDPIQNQQIEIAFKNHWLNNALHSNLTFYRIRQSELNTFLYFGGSEESVNIKADDVISKGVSFNITGSISSNLEIIANISYNQNMITAEAVRKIGAFTIVTPLEENRHQRHSMAARIANTWINYSTHLPKSDNSKINIGIGVKYVSERSGDDANTFQLPSYSKVDFIASYTHKNKFEIGIAVRNLFDKYYYETSLGTNNFVETGSPRTFSLSIKSSHGF